jgi:phage-related tail fiber protein
MANYKTIHTTYGLQRMGQAEATGTPINLTKMAVGDGNGNPVTLSASQTNLVREIAGTRLNINAIYQDPTDPTKLTAELIVPASLGGFVMREVGIYDDAGGLFAVGNLPDTYKPNSSEGAFADTVVRMVFQVTNAAVVSIVFDPNVTVATRTWVQNNVTIGGLLPGGTTHQVLRKKSNANGDTEWADPTDANVVVQVVDETQTLAAGQASVTLAICTTVGSVAFVEGVKLRPDQWVPTDATHANLVGVSFTAGAKLEIIQNLPAGSVPYPLVQSLNLSDVLDKAAARTNLGVYSKAEVDQLISAGDIKYVPRNTAPAGWLKANGAAISRTAYANLFAVIGTTFGAGDGFNTFNLPDLRGEFIRGWDDSRGVDSGRALGTSQSGQNANHSHGVSDPGHTHLEWRTNGYPVSSYAAGSGSAIGYVDSGQVPSGSSTTGISISSDGGNEARPRNIALLACIKY